MRSAATRVLRRCADESGQAVTEYLVVTMVTMLLILLLLQMVNHYEQRPWSETANSRASHQFTIDGIQDVLLF